MRRTYEYAAMTKDECNAADGRFPTASRAKFILDKLMDSILLIIHDFVKNQSAALRFIATTKSTKKKNIKPICCLRLIFESFPGCLPELSSS